MLGSSKYSTSVSPKGLPDSDSTDTLTIQGLDAAAVLQIIKLLRLSQKTEKSMVVKPLCFFLLYSNLEDVSTTNFEEVSGFTLNFKSFVSCNLS